MNNTARSFVRDVARSYFTLLKIMVPALIVVRLMDQAGLTQWLGWLLSPLMSSLGLSNEMGLVWATAILTNIYTAMVVYFELAASHDISVAQISTLGVMILVSHGLPVEGAVARLLAVPWRLTILLRVLGAYGLGMLTYGSFQLTGLGEQPAGSIWQPQVSGTDWWSWSIEQLQMLGSILVILAVLMASLRLLRWLGVERWLNSLIRPLMHIMTVDKNAANVTMIGLLLGLSFGAGLLIDEARSGRISKRDMQIVACFLGLCHSVIEDTLLIMLLGAHLIPLLVGRLLFSCVLIVLIAKYIYPKPVSQGEMA